MKKILKKFLRYIGRHRRQIFLAIPLAFLVLLVFLPPSNIKSNKTISDLSLSPSASPLYQDFHLLIPSLDINAPVIPDVNGADQDSYDKALEGGVAQLQGSSKPGEGSNVFIFGHSSFYWYKPGDYKKIFVNLEDIKIGDEIIIWYNQKEYKYKVTETKVVSPSEIDVLKPTSQEQVTLMTCVPPGTTLKRFIAIAKLE